MPRGFMDDLEGEIPDEEFHECALGDDILSADPNREDALLLNIREYRVFCVPHNVSRFICSNGIGKILKSLFNMCAEIVLTLVCNGNTQYITEAGTSPAKG